MSVNWINVWCRVKLFQPSIEMSSTWGCQESEECNTGMTFDLKIPLNDEVIAANVSFQIPSQILGQL